MTLIQIPKPHCKFQSATSQSRNSHAITAITILKFYSSTIFLVINIGISLRTRIYWENWRIFRDQKVNKLKKIKRKKMVINKVKKVQLKKYNKYLGIWKIKIIFGISKITSYVSNAIKLDITGLSAHKQQLAYFVSHKNTKLKTALRKKCVTDAMDSVM